MGDKSSHKSSATLLAAVSVIAISVGMEPALADNDHPNGGILIGNGVPTGVSKQHKDSTQIKMESNQHKMNSNQLKLDSNHIKIDSQQVKGHSVQQKQNTKALNPQPEPPG
jgi:hypothetical protein